MHKVTELNLILFCFTLISKLSNYLFFYQYSFYHWFNCNVIRLSKSSYAFFFIYPCRQITFYGAQEQVIFMHLNLNLSFIYFIFSRLIYCISFSTFHFISSTFRSITNHLEAENVLILYLLYMKALLICCGDIEINPSPNSHL